MSAGGNLPNLKQLRKMVKETESKLKGSRPPENEEDVIREYEIPEPRTKALLKEEMQALENELTEHFEENYVDDDLNLSEGSDNKEIDVVSPFAGTIRDLDPLLKSHGTELKDSVFLTWSGPGEVHTEKLRPTDDDAVRIIHEQEKTIQEQQTMIRDLSEKLRRRERTEGGGERAEEYERQIREMEGKYQSLLSLCQDFEAKSRHLLQANRLLQDHLLRLTQSQS